MSTIDVRYSCALCGVTDVEVAVPVRESSQDVLQWMEGTIVVLVADHRERSPGCHPTELKNVKVPVPPGTQFIGGPVVQ